MPEREPEEQLERTGDELEERLSSLDENLDDARQKADERRRAHEGLEEGAGDWEDTEGNVQGADPEGTKEDEQPDTG